MKPSETRLLDIAQQIGLTSFEGDPAYMARPLVQCTLPHRNPGNVPAWSRINGRLSLTVQPHYDRASGEFQYPFGTIPRLLLFWITTEAVTKKSPHLKLGRSLREFMLEIGLDPDRGGTRSDRRRIHEQTRRLLRSRLSFEEALASGKSTGERWLDLQIANQAVLWWDPATSAEQPGLFESEMRLTDEFFRAITAAPIPIDPRALHALKGSSLALDLYVWAAYKTFSVNRNSSSARIPWAALMMQFGADYANLRDFRRYALLALQRIKAVYPGLQFEPAPDALVIHPGDTPVLPRA